MSFEKYPLFTLSLISLIHPLYIAAIALAARSLHVGRAVGLALILLVVFLTCFCRSASDDESPDNFINASAITHVMLSTIDYVFLQNYQPEIRKIGQKKPTSEMSLRERLWWAVTLTIATRGVGWKHEPTSRLPPRPTQSRSRFILSQLFWFAFFIIQHDIAANIIRVHPSSAAKGPAFGADGWLWRSTVWVHVVVHYQNIAIFYTAASILGVTLGLSGPKEWPPLFDSPKKAYTVRNVWGRVWHQMLRKVLTTIADFFGQTLLLKNGLFKRYFKLFVVFFFSGVIHYAGDYIVLQNLSEPRAIHFFVLQAIVITFEDAVISVARRLGFTKRTTLSTLVGYSWVFAWFTYSLPVWFDPVMRGGFADSAALRVWFFHIL